MKPIKSFTPNARIIYKESLDTGKDWSSICGDLDQFIEKLPNANLANPYVSLIFFVPSNDEFFESEDVWVGREIIGHVAAVEEEYGVYDLDQAEVIETEILNNPYHLMKFWRRRKNSGLKLMEPQIHGEFCGMKGLGQIE